VTLTRCFLSNPDAQKEKYWGARNGEQLLRIGEHPLIQESALLIARRVVYTEEASRDDLSPGHSLIWLKTVLDWLQANVDPERLKKVYLWNEEMWSGTRKLKEQISGGCPTWERGTPQPHSFVAMDPDAPYHGLELDIDDSEKEQHFLYALWMLHRTGHVGWVRQLNYAGRAEEVCSEQHRHHNNPQPNLTVDPGERP